MLKFNKKGFTIMELVVVLGVFSISSIIIVEIFMFTNKSQKKIIEWQKLQDDISYTLEVMARSVRLGRVDYDHYATVNNPVSELYLYDSDGRAVVFRKENDPAKCADNDSAPCITQGVDADANGVIDETAALTSKGVKVNDVKFYIVPKIDPFFRQACKLNSDCPLSSCLVTQLCEVPDEQPIVTIVIDAVKTKTADPNPANLVIQTSVSSREFYR